MREDRRQMSRLERLNERYHEHHGRRQEFVFGADDRAGLIAELVGGPDLHILDLGCRTGALTQHYAEGNVLVGVDVDQHALEQASARLGIETVWADVEEGLPFEDDSFDVVYSMLALMHLPIESRRQVFCEAARVLRPGGRMVIGVKNQNFERLHEGDRFAAVDITDVERKQLLFTRTRGGTDLEAPWASFSPDDLARLFATAGLMQVHLRGNCALTVWLADSILADPAVRAVVTRFEDLLAECEPFNRYGYHLLAEAVKPARR